MKQPRSHLVQYFSSISAHTSGSRLFFQARCKPLWGFLCLRLRVVKDASKGNSNRQSFAKCNPIPNEKPCRSTRKAHILGANCKKKQGERINCYKGESNCWQLTVVCIPRTIKTQCKGQQQNINCARISEVNTLVTKDVNIMHSNTNTADLIDSWLETSIFKKKWCSRQTFIYSIHKQSALN